MAAFNTTANQKIISIGKLDKDGNKTEKGQKEACNKENIYLKINKQAYIKAMQQLTPTNFQVWLYLASQKEGYPFAFSPTAIAAETSLKKSALQEGIRVLIKEKYLIKRNDNSNIYDFYELPQAAAEEDTINIQIHKEQQESGFIF